MKKTLTILIAFIAIIATSCTKKYEVTPNQTILTTVPANAWKTTDGGKTYSATVNMPEIDGYFNQNGAVLVYGNFGNNTWEQFPEVYQGVAYSFSHTIGSLEIDLQNSNGTSIVTPPSAAFGLKVVLVDSQ